MNGNGFNHASPSNDAGPRFGGNNTIAAVLILGLASSVWTVLNTASGVLMLAWCIAWGAGAAVAGWRRRSWWWPMLCPSALIGMVLVWELLYGPASWASTYVMMLGTTFAVTATIGAVIGTWLGRRRRSSP